MTVTKRGNRFQAYITVGKERHRRNFATKVEALIWEEQVRDAITLNKPLPDATPQSSSTTWSLDDAASRTWAMFWEGSRSEEKVAINMNRALNYFGKRKPVADISTEAVDDYILFLKGKKLANATINRNLAALSKMLTVSLDYNKIIKKPKINRLKETNWRMRWFTVDEVNILLHTAKTAGYTDLYDAIAVSVDTGVRLNELQEIKESSIRDGRLNVDGKNHDWRSIPLTHRAYEILSRRAEVIRNLSPPVDPNRHHVRVRLFPEGGWLRPQWERVRGLAFSEGELKPDKGYDIVWHTMRHTFGSRLAQKGVALQVIKDLMGHRTIQTTLRYAKLAPTNAKDAIASLE